MITRGWRLLAAATALQLCGTALADTSLAPRPAEIMPRAAHTTLIDISAAGEAWIAVGDRGHILRSVDAENWTQVASPVRSMLNRVLFIDEQRGWAAGHDADILHSSDGGRSWALQHHDAKWGKPLYDLVFLDASNGIAVGANSRMLLTDDGGAHWVDFEDHDLQLHGVNLYSIGKLADGSLLIAGEKAMLAHSTDRGASWRMLRSPYSGSFFGALPDGERGALLFGLRGTVYRITDVHKAPSEDVDMWDEFELKFETDAKVLSAMGWEYLPNELKESLFGGARLPSGEALLVGVNGATVVSSPSGMQPLALGAELSLSDAALSGTDAILIGLGGVERRSLPAGLR